MRAVRGLASFRRFFGPRRGGGNGGGGVTSDRKDGPIGEMSDDEASAARKKPEALVCDIEEEMENECCICLIDMEERKFRGKMDCCDHVVCWCCIQEWSQTSRSCPICQRVYNKCKKVEHKCKKKRHTKPGQAGDKGKRQPSLWEKVGGRLMRRRFGSARTSPTPSTAGAQSWSDAEGDDGANLHLQEVVIVGRPVPDDRASSDGGHSSNRSSRSSHSNSSRSSSGSSNRDNNSSRAEDGDDLLRAHLHVDVIDNHQVPAEADDNDDNDGDNNINDADNDVGQLVDVDLADVDDNDGEAAAPVTVETVESPVGETEVAFADQTSGQTSVASSASLSSSSSLLSSASSSFSCSTTSSSSSSSSSSSATGDEEVESSQTTTTSTSTTTSSSSSTTSSSSSRLNTKDSLFSAQEVKEEEEVEDERRDEAASVVDHNSDDVDQKGKGKERETASLLEEDEAKDSDSDSSDDEEDEEEDEDENEEDDADYDDNGPLFGRMPEDNGY